MIGHVPKRISRNIGNYDRRSAIRRRPARPGTGSNRQLFHLLPPSFGKTRARDGIEMKTVGTKQQNRSKRTGAVLLDNHAQRIQDLPKWNASRDDLEKTLFTSEQGLSSLALADIYRGSGITIDFARFAEGRSAYPLHMLNRSVRKRDSKFDVESLFLLNCFIEASLNKRSIFRMNRFQKQLERWFSLLRIEAKDQEMFL